MKKGIIGVILCVIIGCICIVLKQNMEHLETEDNKIRDFNNTHYEYDYSDLDFDIDFEMFDYHPNYEDEKKIELTVCIDEYEVDYRNFLMCIDDSLPDLDISFKIINYNTLNDKLGLKDNDGNIIDITLFNDDSYYDLKDKSIFLKLSDCDTGDEYVECCKNAYKSTMFAVPHSFDIKVIYYNENYLDKNQLSSIEDIISCDIDNNVKNLGITLDNETILSLIASIDYEEYKKINNYEELKENVMANDIINYFKNDKIEVASEEDLIKKLNRGEIAAIIADSNVDYNFKGNENIKCSVIPKFLYKDNSYDMLSTVKIHWLGVNVLSSHVEEAKKIADLMNSKYGQYWMYSWGQRNLSLDYICNYVNDVFVDNKNLNGLTDRKYKISDYKDRLLSYEDSIKIRQLNK